MFLRTPVGTPRLFKVGRTGKLGRQPPPARGTATLSAEVDTSKLGHVARRRIAAPPMAKIEAAVEAVGEALQAWADRFIAAVMREVVRPVVQDSRSHNLRADASVEQVYASLDDPKVAKSTLESTFRAVDKASSDDLRVVGVRTGSIVPNADRLQSEWIRKNTDLIKAQKDVASRVQKVIEAEVTSGKSVADIRKLLEEQAGYARSRAELTARDQTLKLYGQIQQERQQAAGFTHYVWTTSLDERVREEHAELDGQVIAWDDPPVVDRRTGRRAHAGMDFQCRCSAVPFTGDDVVEAESPDLAGEDLPDVPFEVRLPEPPQPDINAERVAAEQARLAQEAELARLEAERAAERAALEAEAERQRVAAERARIEAEAERARVEAERMARIRAEEAAAKPQRDVYERLKDHTYAVRVAEDVADSKKFLNLAADTLEKLKIEKAPPLTRIVIERSSQVEAFGTTVNAGGSYGDGLLRMSVDTAPRKSFSLAKVYTISETAQTVEEVFAHTLTHEFAHHVHLTAGRQVDKIISQAYQEAAPKAWGRYAEARRAQRPEPQPNRSIDAEGAPSIYGTANHKEFFAEAFDAYHSNAKEWLRERKPVAFKMVEDVLALLK